MMIPANTGFVLVATAVLGAVLLGERVSVRNAAVLAMLITALIVLGYGFLFHPPSSRPRGRRPPMRLLESFRPRRGRLPAQSPWPRDAGPSTALLAIALRYSTGAGTSLSAAVLIITGCGVLTLGPISLWQAGRKGWLRRRFGNTN